MSKGTFEDKREKTKKKKRKGKTFTVFQKVMHKGKNGTEEQISSETQQPDPK